MTLHPNTTHPRIIATFSTLQQRFNKIHNNKYFYNNTVYQNDRSKIVITCPLHGDFSQRVGHHLQGRGCPECGKALAGFKNSVILSNTTEGFIKNSIKVHEGKYIYSKVNYVNADTKITIICTKHGEFEQLPRSHLSGHGCPNCAPYGFNPNKPAILYYLKIIKNESSYYKIGITNNSLKLRFKSDMQYITVLNIKEYLNGIDAYIEEQRILKEHLEYRYIGPSILLYRGNTELFTKDVLNLDIKE